MFVTRCLQSAPFHFVRHPAVRRRSMMQHDATLPLVLKLFESINEQDTSIDISIDMPGVKASDLSVNVDNHVLAITGHHIVVSDNHNRSLNFSHKFALDTVVDADNLSANLLDGVLTTTAPKIEKPCRLQVKITEEHQPMIEEDTPESVEAIVFDQAAESDGSVLAAENKNNDDEVVMVETPDEDDTEEDETLKL